VLKGFKVHADHEAAFIGVFWTWILFLTPLSPTILEEDLVSPAFLIH